MALIERQYTTYHTYIRQKYSPPRTNFEETNYMVFGTYGWMVWRMKFVAWFMLLICMLEQFAKYCSFVCSFARCVMIVIVIIWRVVGFVWFSVNVLDCVML